MATRTSIGSVSSSRQFTARGVAILTASVGAGFAVVAFDLSPTRLLLIAVAAAVSAALLIYPEFALALYVVVGDIKGDDRVAALFPIDLTIVIAAILLAGIALNFLRRRPVAPMPPIYFLFLALVGLMTASLAYTPVPEAGVEKLARFLTVTGIVIVAPFFVLGYARRHETLSRRVRRRCVCHLRLFAHRPRRFRAAGNADEQHDRPRPHRVRVGGSDLVYSGAAIFIPEAHAHLFAPHRARTRADRLRIARPGGGARSRSACEFDFLPPAAA